MLTIDEKFKLRNSFLDLTSDSAIRMAAYTKDEWLRNGGSLLSYGQVAYQDFPPLIEAYSGGLLGIAFANKSPEKCSQNSAQRAKNIEEHWVTVKSHPHYMQLVSNSNFVKAWDKYQKQKSSKLSKSLASMFVINEFSDFRFLRMVTFHIGFQMLCEEVGYKPTYPDVKTIDKAKGYIAKIQSSFKDGVKINNLSDQFQLQKLLEQLLLEMNRAPRKEKATPTLEKRKCLESFAIDFLNCFQFISPAILTDLAGMLDWSAEHTTIDRIVKSTKTKKRNALAKLLSNTAQNS